MLRPKKNSYEEFDDEKKFLWLENSPSPHNFSNGPSLNKSASQRETCNLKLPIIFARDRNKR